MAKTRSQFEYEKEGSRFKSVKEKFMKEQIQSEMAVWALWLMGYSAARAKEVVRQWDDEKTKLQGKGGN